VPTSLTTINVGQTAEIQAASPKIIAVRRVIAQKAAIVQLRADTTPILPDLGTTAAPLDLRFTRDDHGPTVPALQALTIYNAGMANMTVWVHWELQ